MNSNTARLSCRLPSRPTPIEIKTEISNLVKFFAHGVHVVVEQGTHRGESGTVVHVQGSSLKILSDQAAEELEVNAADCRQSNLVGTVGHQVGSWRLFDLVALVDGVTVGCLAKMTPTFFTIITAENQAVKVELPQIRSSLRGRRNVPDRLQNPITLVAGAAPCKQNTASIGGIALTSPLRKWSKFTTRPCLCVVAGGRKLGYCGGTGVAGTTGGRSRQRFTLPQRSSCLCRSARHTLLPA